MFHITYKMLAVDDFIYLFKTVMYFRAAACGGCINVVCNRVEAARMAHTHTHTQATAVNDTSYVSNI